MGEKQLEAVFNGDGSMLNGGDEVKGQIRRRIGGAHMTERDISKLLSVFDTQGVLSSHGGISKFRTVNDMRTQ